MWICFAVITRLTTALFSEKARRFQKTPKELKRNEFRGRKSPKLFKKCFLQNKLSKIWNLETLTKIILKIPDQNFRNS